MCEVALVQEGGLPSDPEALFTYFEGTCESWLRNNGTEAETSRMEGWST